MQDIAALGALCRERGVAFHSDCAQAAGKVPLDVAALAVDLPLVHRPQALRPEGRRRAVRARRGAARCCSR